jgi:hypothetical protein
LKDEAVTGSVLRANEVLEGVSEIARNGETESARLRAFELMGKYHKLFTDKQDVNVTFSLRSVIKESYGEKGGEQ